MEDEDGTCLLDVLCDPQALNDFLHGTNELQTEDLLISCSSGEASLFTDAPSPISLLGDGSESPDTPPPGCVDLSFLEEVLLSSPEGGGDPRVVQGGAAPADLFEAKKGSGAEEAEGACDILQQSLQEAEITEQTMALEAGLAPPGDGLSLYPPAPLLSPFVHKPISQAPPRDTQAAVDPPQPSLLAVGPGCPSLKPAAPPQLMGLLPGNVFAAASPETSFSLSPAQARALVSPTLRAAAAAAGLVLQRAPFPIQPKLPVSIQPRLVQISPKPPGQKHTPGLTFLPGTASPNMFLSPPPGHKAAAPPAAPPAQQLPKPVSLQLVNQGGSFVLQPQGLFQGQNQFLLPGQSPVSISQSGGAARPVPQRQLNFSPIFTTSSGQLALRQAAVLSGPLQLQSAPPTVFQMPAQLAGAYAPPGGQGQRATLVHGPALGNHITLINSAGPLPPDLTSISIVNGPSVVRGLPFAGRAPAPQTGEGPLSVVLLPERAAREERTGSEETLQQLSQPFGHVLRHASVQPGPAGPRSSPPPAVTVPPPPPPEAPGPPPDPEPAAEIPELSTPPAGETRGAEEVTRLTSHNEALMHNLQQRALSSPVSSELSVGAAPTEPLAAPGAAEGEDRPQGRAASGQDRCIQASPLHSDPADALLVGSPSPLQDTEGPAPPTLSPQTPASGPEGSVTAPQSRIEPRVQYQVHHQLQASQAQNPVQIEPSEPQPQHQHQVQVQHQQQVQVQHQQQVQVQVQAQAQVQVQAQVQAQVQPSASQPQSSPPPRVSVPDPTGGDGSAVQQHTQIKPTAALVVESEAVAPDVPPHPPSPAAHRGPPTPTPTPTPIQTSHNTGTTAAHRPAERPREERLTAATRRHRFQQQISWDRAAVQAAPAGPAFPSLKDAVKRLLPYHSCAGHLPTQEDFDLVDEEFDAVSGFLLQRTKDMVNKYRQLLVREAQQESPSAEMVMLERLFLQAERCALVEDRRRVRRDPESFTPASATSASPPAPGAPPSGSARRRPPSPPAWTRLSDRPPGLKTYRSSSRGALRLTIKQEAGCRKAGRHKRDHGGQLTNGGQRHPRAPNGAPRRPERHEEEEGEEREDEEAEEKDAEEKDGEEVSNGAVLCDAVKEVPQAAPLSTIKAPNRVSTPGLESPPGDARGPKLKRYGLGESPRPEPRFSPPPPPQPPPPQPPPPQPPPPQPPPPPLQEDNMLSEHLQSAIDSILELQRLQGPPAAPARAAPGVLEGHL